MKQILFSIFLLCLSALSSLGIISARAATTEALRDDTFESLQQGELDEVALTSDGFLYPTYARKPVGDTGTEIVWSALQQESKHTILCATGHEGKLVRFDQDGHSKVIGDLPEPELTCLLGLDDGSTLIGAAPTGRIYRLNADDELSTFTQLQAKFIWDMVSDGKGTIWAATGDEGKVFKIIQVAASKKEEGKPEPKPEVKVDLAFTLHSKNALDLWIDAEGAMGEKNVLFIAGQNPGWLYKLPPGAEKPSVVFSASADEIRTICPTSEGLALAINTERSPTPQALNMTLRMAGGSGGGPGGDGGEGGGAPAAQAKPDSKAMGDVFTPSGKPGAFGPMSGIVLLTPEGFVKPVWTSPERPIHSLATTPEGHLLVAAGGRGRMFELLPRDTFALVADLREDFIVKILPTKDGWLLACARNGVLMTMDHQRTEKAIYKSRVIDAKTQVRWGQFYWSGEAAEGQKVRLAFRKGNTDDPEQGNWTDWTTDQLVATGQGIAVPSVPSRYLQYRITLEQGRKETPLLRSDYVEAFYQQPNRSPRVRKIIISDSGSRTSTSNSSGGGAPPDEGADGGSQKETPSKASGNVTPVTTGGGEVQGGGRKADSNPKTVNISWSGEDPNGDSLLYAVYYKASDETEWKLIQDELHTTRLPLGVSGVGDGRYRFKVVATDKLDNPPGAGLETELVSEEIVIDNTPPVVRELKVSSLEDRARVTFKVSDELSLISSIMVDVDGGDAYPILPVDGLFDQLEESVDWTTLKLAPGEHVVTVNATDRRGNSSAQKAVFKVGK